MNHQVSEAMDNKFSIVISYIDIRMARIMAQQKIKKLFFMAIHRLVTNNGSAQMAAESGKNKNKNGIDCLLHENVVVIIIE